MTINASVIMLKVGTHFFKESFTNLLISLEKNTLKI